MICRNRPFKVLLKHLIKVHNYHGKCLPELLHPGEDGVSDLQGLGHGVSDRLLKKSSWLKEGVLKDHFNLLSMGQKKINLGDYFLIYGGAVPRTSVPGLQNLETVLPHANEAQSFVNKTLDGSTYPG